MKINKNNLFARYYKWIYGNLPNDVCSFFWGSVLAIGLFPILVVGRLFNNSYNLQFGKVLGTGILFYVIYTVIGLLGLIWYADFCLDLKEGEDFMFSEHYHLLNLSWYGLLFGMPLFAVGIMIITLLVAAIPVGLIYLILKGLGVTLSATKQTVLVQNTKDFISAIKRDHCTRIDWD